MFKLGKIRSPESRSTMFQVERWRAWRPWGLTRAPESRNRKASGTGGVNGDWLRMSWGSAGPDHGWPWSWGRAVEFYFMCKRSLWGGWVMMMRIGLWSLALRDLSDSSPRWQLSSSHVYVPFYVLFSSFIWHYLVCMFPYFQVIFIFIIMILDV